MKKRPWLRVYILMALSMIVLGMIPQGVTAQEDDFVSWDTFQSTWTQINYENITRIWIQHPVNGSLVSDNQKLNFIVVPFDIDDLQYTMNVYKNSIMMYTVNQEIVYDLGIYTTNPINQIVTVMFTLNGKEVLRLEYLAVLLTPSMNQDFTDMYLLYKAERMNQSLSGREVVTMRDKAMSDINLVATTGGLCILFTTVAGLIVIIFKLISMLNAFTAMTMFISGFFWIDSIRKIDTAMRSISIVTASDVTVYWSTIVTLSLIFVFSLISYVIGYKIGKSRLIQWKFWGQDINNRKVTEYETVIHKEKGKFFWWVQNSWDAFKQAVFKQRHELHFSHGDITDTFELVRAKNIPENNDDHKAIRAMTKLMNTVKSNLAFAVEPKTNPINPKLIYSKKKLNKLKKSKLMEIAKILNAPSNGSKKELVNNIITKQKADIAKQKADHAIKTQLGKATENIDRKYNFEAWKYDRDGSILKSDIPIIMLDGNPDFIDVMTKEDFDKIDKELDTIKAKTEKAIKESDAKEAEDAEKRFKLLRKKRPKPYARVVDIKLSSATNYDTLHFQAEANYLPKLSKKYADKDRECHKLQMEQEVRTSEKAKEKYLERDRQLRELKERHEGGGVR